MSHPLLMSCGYVSNQSLVAGVGSEHGLAQRVRSYEGEGRVGIQISFLLSFYFYSVVYSHSYFKVSSISLNV